MAESAPSPATGPAASKKKAAKKKAAKSKGRANITAQPEPVQAVAVPATGQSGWMTIASVIGVLVLIAGIIALTVRARRAEVRAETAEAVITKERSPVTLLGGSLVTFPKGEVLEADKSFTWKAGNVSVNIPKNDMQGLQSKDGGEPWLKEQGASKTGDGTAGGWAYVYGSKEGSILAYAVQGTAVLKGSFPTLESVKDVLSSTTLGKTAVAHGGKNTDGAGSWSRSSY
jgi:hypothetical protein